MTVAPITPSVSTRFQETKEEVVSTTPTTAVVEENVFVSEALAKELEELGEPTLPASELHLGKELQRDQHVIVAGVLGAVGELVQENVKLDSVKTVLGKVDWQAGAELDGLLDTCLSKFEKPAFNSTLAASFVGEKVALLTENHAATSVTLLKHTLFAQNAGPAFGFTNARFDQGIEAVKGLLLGEETPTLEPQGPFAFVDGKLVAKDTNAQPMSDGQIVRNLILVAEAGFEYYIGLFSQLQSDDVKKQLEVLKSALEYLKQQKVGLLKEIQKNTMKLMGMEMGNAQQAKKAKEAAKKAKRWGVFKAVALVIVAIIVAIIAIILTPFTGGMSLALLACVCTLISCAITVIQQIPQLLQALAMLMDALGMHGAADALEASAEWLQKNVMDNKLFQQVCMWIQIACAVCSLGCGLAGSGVAAASQSARLINLAVQIGAGVLNIAMGIAMSKAQQDLIAAMRNVLLLKAEMAKIEVQIKQIMVEIERLEKSESNETDRQKHNEEIHQAITDNLQAAADKGREMWNALVAAY